MKNMRRAGSWETKTEAEEVRGGHRHRIKWWMRRFNKYHTFVSWKHLRTSINHKSERGWVYEKLSESGKVHPPDAFLAQQPRLCLFVGKMWRHDGSKQSPQQKTQTTVIIQNFFFGVWFWAFHIKKKKITTHITQCSVIAVYMQGASLFKYLPQELQVLWVSSRICYACSVWTWGMGCRGMIPTLM